MTYIEKNSKYIILLGLLAFLIYNNLSNLNFDESRAGEAAMKTGFFSTLTSLLDWRVF